VKNNLKKAEEALKIKFKKQSLLRQALTHRSYLNEHPDQALSSNERLEFLGDAILELFISKALFEKYPKLPEGDLTAMRSRVVCTDSLAKIGKNLHLGEHLLLSKGEETGGGRKNKSLLANSVEALIGAIFLDQGRKACEGFILKNFKPVIENLPHSQLKDAKSLLQEKIQEKQKLTPYYKILAEKGPDHAKTFIVGVFADSEKLGEGKGNSKQEAEEKAAKAALEKF